MSTSNSEPLTTEERLAGEPETAETVARQPDESAASHTTRSRRQIDGEALAYDYHTPGPWEYWPAQNYDGFAIAPRGILPTLASVERCGHLVNIRAHNFPGSTEANARLIAAAPDLLAALKELLASQLATMPPFEAGKDAQNAWSDRRAKARNDAAFVIAKAEGRS